MIPTPSPRLMASATIHRNLADAGLMLYTQNAVLRLVGPGTDAENDAAAQAIIDGFDLLADVKKTTRQAIRAERDRRYLLLYAPDHADDNATDGPAVRAAVGATIDLAFDLWGSIKATAKATTTDWQKLLDTRSAASAAVTAVNACTTVEAVDAIAPAWPP